MSRNLSAELIPERYFFLVTFFFLIGLMTAGKVFSVELSFDDFAPVKSGNIPEPKGKVEQGKDYVKADNAQDGLNYALHNLLQDGEGVEEILVPSGFAVISVGSATYNTYKNRNATLIGKRAAYARAMLMAKKQMLEHFKGTELVATESLKDSTASIDSGADENQTNSSLSQSEDIKEVIGGVLRGNVIYYTKDSIDDNMVLVALASSTKTRVGLKEQVGSVIRTDDPKKAGDSLLKEIANSFVPPAGARLITNPLTGESTVVAFGSQVVRVNRDKGIARKLKRNAKKQAQQRANKALVSFLKGDQIHWEGGFDEKVDESATQFEIPGEGERRDPGQIDVFENTKREFLSVIHDSEAYSNVTKGRVPPGVNKKSFISEDGDWAIAISAYSPSMTARAEQAHREMENGGKRSDDIGVSAAPREERKREFNQSGGFVDDAENPKGPSGQATKDSDL